MKLVFAALLAVSVLQSPQTVQQYRIAGLFRFDYPIAQWKVVPGIDNENPWLVEQGETAKDPNDARVAFHSRSVRNGGTLTAVVDTLVGALENSKFATSIGRVPFTTTAGASGIKVEYKLSDGRFAVQYLFNGRQDYKFIVDGISPFPERETYEPIYDRLAKSFVVE